MYQISQVFAANLQKIRKERGITLQELAQLTDVSKSMLGEIERGTSNPTINVVWKIANGLKVPISTLISEESPNFKLVTRDQWVTIEKGTYTMSLIFECDHPRDFEVHHVAFAPGQTHESTGHHEGVVEYMMVYEGQLVISVGQRSVEMQPGDSFIFDAEKPHAYFNPGPIPTKAYSLIYYPGA